MLKFNYRILVLLLLLGICFLFSQNNDTSSIKTESQKYTTATHFYNIIQFEVSGVNEPKEKNAKGDVKGETQYLLNPEDSKSIQPYIKKYLKNDQNPDRINDPLFEWHFIPQKAGIYRVTLLGEDASRNDKKKTGSREITVEVLEPYLKKRLPQNIYEDEDIDLDFSTNGYPDESNYSIILRKDDYIDTLKNKNIVKFKKNTKYEIKKGDKKLTCEVLYFGRPLLYLEDSLSNDKMPKPAIFSWDIKNLQPVLLNFKLPNPIEYTSSSTRVEFTIRYMGNKVHPEITVSPDLIEYIEITKDDDGSSLIDDDVEYQELGKGMFGVKLKSNLRLKTNDEWDISVSIKLKNNPKIYTAKTTLIKAIKTTR